MVSLSVGKLVAVLPAQLGQLVQVAAPLVQRAQQGLLAVLGRRDRLGFQDRLVQLAPPVFLVLLALLDPLARQARQDQLVLLAVPDLRALRVLLV